MPQTYKIVAVKSQAKDWDSKYGPMKTYLVQFEGNGEPVQINKKADSPVPQVGEEVYGTIQETEYGQKFKSEKQFNGGFKGQPKDEAAIKAMWAIGQAVSTVQNFDDPARDVIGLVENRAKDFFAMVDRVKGSSESISPKEQNQYLPEQSDTHSTPNTSTTTTNGSGASKQPARPWDKLGQHTEPDYTQEEVDRMVGAAVSNGIDNGEPINLDDIPF